MRNRVFSRHLVAVFALILTTLPSACGDDNPTAGDDPDVGAESDGAEDPVLLEIDDGLDTEIEPADAPTDTSPDHATDMEADGAAEDGLLEADGPLPFAPTGYCPSSPDCADEGDGQLYVGAGMEEITPVVDATTEQLAIDVDGDGQYEPLDGDTFTDLDDNGEFDGVWIAGFGSGRPATGVNDPQWVRAIAIETNQTAIALVSVDCVGLFHDDVQRIRQAVEELELDYVAVSATHTHEARDTMGQWGADLIHTGVDLDYMDDLVDSAAEAIREAVDDLRAARVEYSSTKLGDQPGGALRYVSDTRDPVIIDDEIRLMRFIEKGGDQTIATLINFGTHPEYSGSQNTLLSSDIVHHVRRAIEQGVVGPDGEMLAGVGGMAAYFSGTVGGQIGPGQVRAQTWDGRELGNHKSLELAEVVGSQLGYLALSALSGDDVVRDDEAPLAFRYTQFEVMVENPIFVLAFRIDLFPTREAVNRYGTLYLNTEVALVDIGRARILMLPGELDPSLFIGGFDGSSTPAEVPIIDPANPNPPDLDLAPEPPYLAELLRSEAEYAYLFGLTNDEIGYLIPAYDFELSSSRPYLEQADGDHYEETNSVGPGVWPTIEERIHQLMEWEPDPD